MLSVDYVGAAGNEGSAEMSQRPVHVLIVEDNDADVHLTTTALRDARIESEIQVVDNGEDALRYLNREDEYLNARRPDLILLDLNLPRKDGFGLLQDIKAIAHLANIPVI